MTIGGVSGGGGLDPRDFPVAGQGSADAVERAGANVQSLDSSQENVSADDEPFAFRMGGPVDVDLSKVGRITKFKTPEGYASFMDYAEDITLEMRMANSRKMRDSDPDWRSKVSYDWSNTYDFLAGDKAKGMDPVELSDARLDFDFALGQARNAENKATRGQNIDPERFLVTVGDKKYTVAEIDELSRGLATARAGLRSADAGERRVIADAGIEHSHATGGYSVFLSSGFRALSVKLALTISGIDKTVANTVFQRYQDEEVAHHEALHQSRCAKAEAKEELVDSYSLLDRTEFRSNMFWQMSQIDTSSEATMRRDFGRFADWYAKGIEDECRGWYGDPKGIASSFKEALFFMKSCYGL